MVQRLGAASRGSAPTEQEFHSPGIAPPQSQRHPAPASENASSAKFSRDERVIEFVPIPYVSNLISENAATSSQTDRKDTMSPFKHAVSQFCLAVNRRRSDSLLS